jgi:Ca2+-binding RTX toxin-like protein
MAAGSTATVTVNGAFVVAGSVTNTAKVTATGDPNTADDQAVAITTVTGRSCTVVGTFGDDRRLRGTNKADVICGLAGDDRINGKHGHDTVYGNEGDDLLVGLGGDDLLDGGPGTDSVSYGSSQQSVRVDLAGGRARGEGNDTLVSVEDVTGSRYDDVLAGDAGPNRMSGKGGDDLLKGRAGPDALYGGPGRDTLLGGPGIDLLDGGSGPDTCRHGAGAGVSRSC